MDRVLDWVESRIEEITQTVLSSGGVPATDFASLGEVSRQLWALLGPLLSGDSAQAGMFANVPRHNGLEVWRRVSEPINEDKALIHKDLFPQVTNRKGASTMDGVSGAL
jgi:hypothetical protein